MSVLPCSSTVPVPLVKVAAPVRLVFWPRTILVAVEAPMFRAPLVVRSSDWVSTEVVPCTVPVVVILSAPVSMAPKPLLMEPEPKAPVPVIAVLTASLVSTRAASLPSSRLNSVASTVTALRTKVELLLPVTVRVPVLLPRPSVLPAVVAMVVLPAMLAPPALTVRPPMPCNRPVPASTPTAVTAPPLLTSKLLKSMTRSYPK